MSLANVGVAGFVGAVVSTVIDTPVLILEVLPATSVAVAVIVLLVLAVKDTLLNCHAPLTAVVVPTKTALS